MRLRFLRFICVTWDKGFLCTFLIGMALLFDRNLFGLASIFRSFGLKECFSRSDV